MTLEHVHGPAFLRRYRDAQRAVLDRAEQVAAGRTNGTLSVAAIDRLTDAQKQLDQLRQAYIRGTTPDRS